MTSMLNMSEIQTLDKHIEQLNGYKPITENEVKGLCDKVSVCCSMKKTIFNERKKFFQWWQKCC